jgi:hypothetical protein
MEKFTKTMATDSLFLTVGWNHWSSPMMYYSRCASLEKVRSSGLGVSDRFVDSYICLYRNPILTVLTAIQSPVP